MGIFEQMAVKDHEQVIFCHDEAAGLRAIIAIHNTTLGPALGGTRMWAFASEEAALEDVLRLSRGMTYKSAAAGLNLGGGKAVIIADPKKDKTEALFRSFGRFVEGLSGRYITAEDVGTTVADMEYVRMETRSVTGIPGTSVAPMTGDWPTTVPGTPGPPGSRTIDTFRAPSWVSTCRAAATSRPIRSGIVGAGAPPLSRSATVDGTLTAEPAAGRVPITVPGGEVLCVCETSPTSNPSFSSSTCASMRVMPVTVGTVTMRCPPLTTSVIAAPSPSRAPGGGDCSRTVILGAELL